MHLLLILHYSANFVYLLTYVLLAAVVKCVKVGKKHRYCKRHA